MVSILNSLVSGQGGLQLSRYIPLVVGLSRTPGEVAMKCTFRHASHMMPMWIGMGGDYGTISLAFWRNGKEAVFVPQDVRVSNPLARGIYAMLGAHKFHSFVQKQTTKSP
jgi:hypothetical protein